jgi:glutamyl-tRNA reductase
VFLYTVDDLQQVVENNLEGRKQEKIAAQEIIKEQNIEFKAWLDNIPNEEIIKQYRQQAMTLKDDAVKGAIKKLSSGAEADAVIQELADQLTNKLLHTPFKNIKQTSHINLEQCKSCIPKPSIKPIKVSNS